MLAKTRLALIVLLLVVGHAAAPQAVRASIDEEIPIEEIPTEESPYEEITFQEITFEAIPNQPIWVFAFELQAVSSAGLPVSYGSESLAVCDVLDGSTVVLWGVGTCTIRASQDGDDVYHPAEPVWQSFSVLPAGHSDLNESTIAFEAIPNKSILVGSFALQGVSSSGLPVLYQSETPIICDLSDENMVLLFAPGTCTITASQDGDETHSPAEPVRQSFSILSGMLANKTITFVDSEGLPIAGVAVEWSTLDNRYRSATPKTTNATGQVTFLRMPAGYVHFSVYGGNVVSDGQTLWWSGVQHVVSVGVAPTRLVGLLSTSTLGISSLVVHVKMTDGTGVPGTSVSITGGSDDERCAVSREEGGSPWGKNGVYGLNGPWSQESFGLFDCNRHNTTDANGDATFAVMTNGGESEGDSACTDGSCSNPFFATAQYTEYDMFVTSETIQIVDGEATILVEQMPVVDLLAESATVNFGAPQLLTAFARDANGRPIVGSTLTLSASVSGASASCSGRKTTATTNSSGRATFKVCPVKSATWSVGGQSVVGSAGVKLTVQRTPTAPRTLVVTPKTRSVSLAWVAPAKGNASAVTDYIIQYRRQGSMTWLTFRDGVSTARKATVTGLKSGQAYEFRIAARSKAGTGTWSNVLRGTPK